MRSLSQRQARTTFYTRISESQKPATRIALYSHDTQGLGHIRRNLAIAQALHTSKLSLSILLISGTQLGAAFDMPNGIDIISLPAVEKAANGHYRAKSLPMSLANLIKLRGDTIRAALAAFAPHLLIVDKVPAGFQNELLPALKLLKTRGGTKFVLGWRDILDDPATQRREWARRNELPIVRSYYDAIWVYGDPTVYNLVDAYALEPAIAEKVRFTGYLDRSQNQPAPQPTATVSPAPTPDNGIAPPRKILCMLGGGQDGVALAEAFVQAQMPSGAQATLLTGPYLPTATFDRLRAAAAEANVELIRFTPTPQDLLCQADRIIAMGGYNAVCEILALGKPALIVPRVQPRREQWIRAARLQEMGWIDCLHPQDLTPAALAAWLRRADPISAHPRPEIDLDGLRRLPKLAEALLRRPADKPAASPEAGPVTTPGMSRARAYVVAVQTDLAAPMR
ncbi:MAG: glycosyltransferase [Litorilinea sp.]